MYNISFVVYLFQINHIWRSIGNNLLYNDQSNICGYYKAKYTTCVLNIWLKICLTKQTVLIIAELINVDNCKI